MLEVKTAAAAYTSQPNLTHTIYGGGVINEVTRVSKLTRGKFLKTDDWSDWQKST